ncbi:MAG: oligosaccharide flippase family protein [Syntrophomonas sp.]
MKNFLFNSSIIKSTLIYTCSNIAVAIVPFLLLPIMTKYLSTSDYGIISNYFLLVSITSSFVGVNVHGAIMLAYYDQEKIDLPLYIKNCLLIIIGSVLVVSIIFLPLKNMISNYTYIPVSWLWTVVVICSIQMIISINLNLWRINLFALKYSFFQITQTLTTLGFSIWLVVFWGLGWKGRIEGSFSVVLIYGIVSIYCLYKDGWLKGKISVNKAYLKEALLFGLCIIPHGLGLIIMQLSDRLFITNMIGINETGIYSVGSQIGMAITLLTSSFLLAFQPWLYEKLSDGKPDSNKKIVIITYLFVIGTIISSLILGTISPFIINLFVDKKFSGANMYVLWLALGYGFYAIYSLFVNFIAYTRRTGIISIITIVSCLINIGLNLRFIHLFGAIGSAYATCFAYLFMAFLSIFFVIKEFRDIHWLPFRSI